MTTIFRIPLEIVTTLSAIPSTPTYTSTSNTGGPAQAYTGRTMTDAHANLGVTRREFDIVMTECRTTFYKLGVPERELEELMALLESYRDRIITRH